MSATDALTILITFLAAVIGYVVGYSRGEDHGIIMAIKVSDDAFAKAWDDRMHELGVEVDE